MSIESARNHAASLSDAWWLLLVVLALLAYLLIAVPEHLAASQGGDYPYYVQIAASPLNNDVPSPWRYRLLNPLLASAVIALGVPTHLAFLTWTAVFAFASCVLMRVYLQQLGTSVFGARAGTLLFAVTVGAYIPLRRYYGYTDALTNAFILLVLVATAARRYIATLVALAVGTVAKESLLLTLPFLARQWSRFAPWHRIALMLGVPVAIYLALRIIVAPDTSQSAPVALTLEAQFAYWETAMVHGPVRWLLWSFAYSFGPVWVLAALTIRRHLAFAGRMSLYALPVLVPLARTTDTERALMLLFPIVIPLAAAAMDACRGPQRVWIAALAVLCAWLAQLTFGWTPELRIGVVNAKDAAFAVLCLLPAAAVMACRQGPRLEPPVLTWDRSAR